jgi:hypothetical protein
VELVVTLCMAHTLWYVCRNMSVSTRIIRYLYTVNYQNVFLVKHGVVKWTCKLCGEIERVVRTGVTYFIHSATYRRQVQSSSKNLRNAFAMFTPS